MSNLKAIDFVKQFGRGWNIGNTLEAIGGETVWGNPKITQRLIDSVRAAGFNAIRLPVAWSRFTDTTEYLIDTNWLARVKEVVNYIIKDSMYVIMNEHWDKGWMQPTYAKQEYVNNRLGIMWEQIAIYFRDFDDHLLFAGTNEVMVNGDYGAPTVEYYTVQNSFNQTFVNTIRSTGGRNVYRYLVVQGFNTNIDYTVSYFTMPQDVINNRLVVEVHYYDPYNFTINSGSTLYVWGKDAPKSESWANESHADAQFKKMQTKFIDNNIPVILGEYCASARLNLGTENNAIHAKYRLYYMQYITRSIVGHGLVPFYWDSGHTGNNASGVFDRSTGNQAYPEIINAIIDTGKVESPVSINTFERERLKIFPNPADDKLYLELASGENSSSQLYDSLGQLVMTVNINNGLNTYDVSHLNPGLYILKLNTREGNVIQKVIKE
jgi:endoglucanase